GSFYEAEIKRCISNETRYSNQIHIYLSDVLDKMSSFNHFSNLGFTKDINHISEYQNYLYKIRDLELVKVRDQIKDAKLKCELTFQEDFISKLRNKIEYAKSSIKKLNNNLKLTPFNGDIYEFVISPSKKAAFKDYYQIIMSQQDYHLQDIFSQGLSMKNQIIMNELFEKLTAIDDDSQNEKIISEYVDYRNYMHYDIKITHANGDITYFSKVNREKSGGETQTPFYVIIASSFEQLINKNKNQKTGCVVLFDEAFNNMDESRIETMMQFYTSLNMQIILAVPPLRMQALMPYMKTVLIVHKDNNQSYLKEFNVNEKLPSFNY
ncbi:MAG: SbcC/MukB-like Walker B domain-containing protein, partial [Bacilli bacterium]